MAVHAALADPARLRIVDILAVGDASPSELAGAAADAVQPARPPPPRPRGGGTHHPRTGRRPTTAAPICAWSPEPWTGSGQRRSGRRSGCCSCAPPTRPAPTSPRRCGDAPASSPQCRPAPTPPSGSNPAPSRPRNAIDLPLRRLRPRHIDDVRDDGDLVVTVCDLAHEELHTPDAVHWSVPDPVPVGTPAAFDNALDELSDRIERLAPRLTLAP